MKARMLIAITLAWIGSQLAMPPAEARSPVLLASCSVLDLEYEPAEWSPGCAGGSPALQELSWSGWGNSSAEATGSVLLNDCDPSCAGGTAYRYPARIKVDGVRRCHDSGRTHRQYTRVRLSWEFPAENPFDEPAGWQAFGLNPLRVSSANCRQAGEPLHVNRLQAQEIATAAVNLTLTRKDWNVYDDGSVTRASGCRRIGGRRFTCRVYARASDLDGYSWWRGRMRIGVGARKASWHWSGRRRKCTDILHCGPAPFSWRGKIGVEEVSLYAATPELGFGGYGAARIGDTPAEVRQHLGERLECHFLAGSCVCASLGEYPTAVVFVFGLDRQPGLDVIFTSSREVIVERDLQVGDSIGRMRSIYPHTHETGRMGYSGYKRFLVSRGALGILAEVHRGRIVGFIVGKKRFFDYEEFCA